MREILVVAEHRKQKVADISVQMLGKGRQLAGQAGADLVAVTIGTDVAGYARELSRYADRVLTAEVSGMQEPLAEPSQRVLSSIIRDRKPFLVLIGHSSFGMDLAPALAVELEVPLVTDCVDVSLEEDGLRAVRPVYNGKMNAVYSFALAQTVIVTGRVGEFPVGEGDRRGEFQEVSLPFGPLDYKRFEGYTEQEAAGVDITEANVLVSVGRGIKDRASIELAERLADALGGVVACSRPVVDYGWLPADRQVGLSGKTVKPKLYLALGISGAFQHVVGMRGANMIVAVNRDPGAPIFGIADYGIVDDILRVIPVLTEKVTGLRS